MKRGRKSASELSIVIDAGRHMPAKPPAELSRHQASIWRDAVASMPGNWLTPAAFPILIAYCRHVCRAQMIEAKIAEIDPKWASVEGGLGLMDKMLAMAERETRAISACARAMRITPQAQMHPRSAGRGVREIKSGAKPWE